MSKSLKILILSFFSLSFFLSPLLFKGILAQECADISNLDAKIECLENQRSKLAAQSKTLSNQIAQFDAQIRLTTLKITQTEEKIALLGGRIDQIEISLVDLSNAFASRVVETYKIVKSGVPFYLLVTSRDLSEAVTRYHYLQRIQEADQDLMTRLQGAQTTYESQKEEEEALKQELNRQKIELDKQKKAKNVLLSQTKNDEKLYQALLSQAIAEKAAIEAALVSGVQVGPVKQGDPIALIGNSGWHSNPSYSCSTGKHLHFEVRKNNNWIDPGPYLNSKTVSDEQNGGTTSIGSGNWPWPIQDPIRLTQHYGQTPYSWKYKYSGGIHTGLDIISSSSDVIRAPADGTLYKYSQLCVAGGNYINIVYIDHGNDLKSFYLHVQ
ncbi:peptidoglycan DD-metalloendopeptidase family protein [Candidatus Woesebacteria bacterium]|nr:peptidoglycan DD-metalloendopeptidase family protein [Candidatus Woesebacteria bacterium]